MIVRTANRLPSDQDYIATRPNPCHAQTDNLAQAALDAVAHHGIADPAADRKSKTAVRQIIGECTYHKHIVRNRAPTLANFTKSPVFPHAVTTLHALLLVLKFVSLSPPAWWPVIPPQLECLRSYTDLRMLNCTERRSRPLRRRRLNTLRPPGVAMRARNPWVLSRLRTFGCQVRFVAMTVSFLKCYASNKDADPSDSQSDSILSAHLECQIIYPPTASNLCLTHLRNPATMGRKRLRDRSLTVSPI